MVTYFMYHYPTKPQCERLRSNQTTTLLFYFFASVKQEKRIEFVCVSGRVVALHMLLSTVPLSNTHKASARPSPFTRSEHKSAELMPINLRPD